MLIESGGVNISLYFTLSLSAIVSLVVSIFVSYRFPLIRQRRAETHEKLTQAIEAIRKFRDASCSYWDDNSLGEGELLNACEDYISEVYALKRRYKIYATLEKADLLKLKGTATLHDSFADAHRSPSEQIKAEIRDASRTLIKTLEDRFSTKYKG